MPTELCHRDDIAAAVAAYDRANPIAPLPRNTTRLLVAMFGSGDTCQRSLDDLAAKGFNRQNLPAVLRRLGAARLIAVERCSPYTYRLHLPAVRP